MNAGLSVEAPRWEAREALRARPGQPVVMHQRWEELLFLHWRVEPGVVQAMLPAGLRVDTFDGTAWVGVVPFRMRGIRPRGLPALPWLSDFLELNLRTYVFDEAGRAGVWFFSLECNQPVAVALARWLFHLPYERAQMRFGDEVTGVKTFESQRCGDGVRSDFRYERTGPLEVAGARSLEWFLVERYLLFALTRGGLRTGRVQHMPYGLQEARVETWDARLFALNGLPMPMRPPDHVVASPGVQVTVYPLVR
jgi:uncharacterized protein YqjF (DUF2071 family)